MSKIITREHPKFDEVLEMAITQMGADVVASNKEAFKASIGSVEWDGNELRLRFADDVTVEEDGGDDDSKCYKVRGKAI
mgnify:CR=1 FL=1